MPSFIFVVTSTVLAYYSFLEEYYLGRLILGKFVGPDDLGLLLTVVSFYTAYNGSEELWRKEYDIFGRGNIRASHIVTYGIIAWISLSTMHTFITNLYAARSTEHFQKRFNLKSLMCHTSFLPALTLVYFTYTQLTGSTVLNEYPKMTNLAFGGEFLLAILHMMVSSVVCQEF